MTIKEELREIEERVAGHTPGPWELTPTHIGPIECHDMGMGWETYSAFRDEDIELARSAPDSLRIARQAVDQLEEAARLLRKWVPFSKRLPATLEYDALAEGTEAFLARLEGEKHDT